MTTRHKFLESQLSKRGIFQSQWDELKVLRTEYLKERGLNPDHYELGSQRCEKKECWKQYDRIMNTIEYLTKEQYRFVTTLNPDAELNLCITSGGGYLNLNVYSEADHHAKVLRMEQGC